MRAGSAIHLSSFLDFFYVLIKSNGVETDETLLSGYKDRFFMKLQSKFDEQAPKIHKKLSLKMIKKKTMITVNYISLLPPSMLR